MYIQKFGVPPEGIVETPRTISGCLLDDDDYVSAISELNPHFVSSHVMNPEGAQDESRVPRLAGKSCPAVCPIIWIGYTLPLPISET